MTELNIEQLKAAALAATPIETDLYGDRYFQGSYSKADLTKAQDDFFTAASPAAVLELIAEVESLRAAQGSAQPVAIRQRRWLGDETWRDVRPQDDDATEEIKGYTYRTIYDAPPAPVSAEPVAMGEWLAKLNKLYVDMTNCDQVSDDNELAGNCVSFDLLDGFFSLLQSAPPSTDAKDSDTMMNVPVGIVAFAGELLGQHRNDGYPGDIDGGQVQALALQYGLIEEREVTEPCGEGCTCAEVVDVWPVECCFNTDAGRIALDAAIAAKEAGKP